MVLKRNRNMLQREMYNHFRLRLLGSLAVGGGGGPLRSNSSK